MSKFARTGAKMEQDLLFTASKWEILKLVTAQERSPIELAQLLHTSVANVSQQLKLLETAGLIKKQRVKNVAKGLPRLLYSLANDCSYLITAAKDFTGKKLVPLSAYNKIILKIWFLDNPEQRYPLEKAFWNMEPYWEKIDGLFLDQYMCTDDLHLMVISKSKQVGSLCPLISTSEGKSCKTNFHVFSPEDWKKELTKREAKDFYALYDPHKFVKSQ